MSVVKKSFYEQETLTVAKSLLGAVLCRRCEDGRILKGKIVETEAYTQEDPSCHAFRGVTKRSKTLFARAGLAYVYFTYGMYHCMNVVTEGEGRGCAVLIRALEPLCEVSATNGPAKLCRAFEITREFNEVDLTKKTSPIWIEEGERVSDKDVVTATRIGIKLAADYPWRFYIKNNPFVSYILKSKQNKLKNPENKQKKVCQSVANIK